MAGLLIGTANGVYRVDGNKGGLGEEDAIPSAAYLTKSDENIFAVTPAGALWKRDRNARWKLINEHPVDEEIWALGCDPRLPGRLYLGVSPALLYISNDAGETWTACESVRRIPGYDTWTFPPPPHIPHVRSIAPDPKAVGAVFIGVEEGGIYRSADGGESWESLNEGLYWDVHTVTPAVDGSCLYSTTGAGFHRSDDGGRHWQRSMAGLDRGYTVPLVTSVEQPSTVYTAAAMLPPPNWARGGANAALYRSEDGGLQWAKLQRGLPEKFDVMVRELVLDEAGDVYAASGNALYASHDAGETWQIASDRLPPVRAIAAA